MQICPFILLHIGALVHTEAESGKHSYAFFDLLQFPHDSNIVIEVILRILINLKNTGQQLPETLYIQLDNCFKENKNKYLFSFCSLLVSKKVFSKVCVCALILDECNYLDKD